MSVNELIAEAKNALGEYPPNENVAQECLKKALGLEPKNCVVLDMFGELLCNLGSEEEGAMMLQRSIELEPEQGCEKYLLFAQCVQGFDALECLRKGLAIFEVESAKNHAVINDENMNPNVEQGGSSSSHWRKKSLAPNPILQKKVSIYCSIAELFMTDLCDEVDAQERCEEAIARALEIDGNSVEALTTSASLKKTVGLVDEAKVLCEKALAVVKSIIENQATVLEILEAKEEGTDEELDIALTVDEWCPSEVRVTLVRTMLDLQMPQEALQILEQMADEDSESIQVVYLQALANKFLKDVNAVTDCVEQIKEMLSESSSEIKEVWKEPFETLEKWLAKVEIGEDPDGDELMEEDVPQG